MVHYRSSVRRFLYLNRTLTIVMFLYDRRERWEFTRSNLLRVGWDNSNSNVYLYMIVYNGDLFIIRQLENHEGCNKSLFTSLMIAVYDHPLSNQVQCS